MNPSTASIEIVQATFAPGEQRTFALSGQYFELIDATNPVDVVLSDVYGAQRGLMRNAEASFNLKNTNFGVIQITSATAQTIRFAYGSGEAGTRRAAGAVNIVGTVPVSGPLTDAQLRAAVVPVRVAELGGASWFNSGAISANTALTVVAPGANVNGILVHHLESIDSGAAYIVQTFLAKSSAPTFAADGEILAQSLPFVVTATPSTVFGVKREFPLRIAPGLGLYYISAAVGAAIGWRNVRYTLL